MPLRNRAIRYEGGFYGQSGKSEPFPDGITPERLMELIRTLPPGWTEIGCHPRQARSRPPLTTPSARSSWRRFAIPR